MRVVAMLILVATVVQPLLAIAEDGGLTAQRLFHIERNKNANIVVYDALVRPDGNLPEKDDEAVVVYWLKLAEGGERKNLKRIEKRRAYGFKVKEREGNRVVIEMVADIGRLITVSPADSVYQAFVDINGRQAVMEKVFIFATEGGLLPTVEYIELFGKDVETGEEAYEKFLP